MRPNLCGPNLQEVSLLFHFKVRCLWDDSPLWLASPFAAAPLQLRYIPLPERRQSEVVAKMERKPNGNQTATERKSIEERYGIAYCLFLISLDTFSFYKLKQ